MKAMLCAKLQAHPATVARGLSCPEIERYRATGLLEDCLKPNRLSRLRLWLPVSDPSEPPMVDFLGIDVDAEEILGALDPIFADAFAPYKPGRCPPPA
jgi:hypothetical protein